MRDRGTEHLVRATEQGRKLMESARDIAERAGTYAQANVSRLSAVSPVAEAKPAQTSSTPDHPAVGKTASRAVDEVFAGWFADAREEELWRPLV